MRTVVLSLFFVVASVAFSGTAHAEECYQLSGGTHSVTIGWFKRQTYRADELCLSGNYLKQGFSSGLAFTLKLDGNEVASYGASAERYTANDVRFTIADGEPEPTQFDARLSGETLAQIRLGGSWIKLKRN